jgi:hypothetical protein
LFIDDKVIAERYSLGYTTQLDKLSIYVQDVLIWVLGLTGEDG